MGFDRIMGRNIAPSARNEAAAPFVACLKARANFSSLVGFEIVIGALLLGVRNFTDVRCGFNVLISHTADLPVETLRSRRAHPSLSRAMISFVLQARVSPMPPTPIDVRIFIRSEFVAGRDEQ